MIARTITAPQQPYPFSAGDVEFVGPWLIHRSSMGQFDAERFDPARWRSLPRVPWFLPFSVGAHRCPAATFARAQFGVARDHLVSLIRGMPPTGPSEPSLIEFRSPALMPSWSRGE